jgi:hypothetical protein
MTSVDLDDIGLCYITEERTKTVKINLPIANGELFLDGIPYTKAEHVIDLWGWNGINHICFKGSITYPRLSSLVKMAKSWRVKNISVKSVNINLRICSELIACGVNHFIVPYTDLDDMRTLAKMCRLTVEIDLGKISSREFLSAVRMADEVADDISLIATAPVDWRKYVSVIPKYVVVSNDLLNYRVNNVKNDVKPYGLMENDTHKCPLALDEMIVSEEYHYPCSVYMEAGGKPIGKVNPYMRKERNDWALNYDTHSDSICSNYCPDFCREYNNKYVSYAISKSKVFRKLQPIDFLDVMFDDVSVLPTKKLIIGYGKVENALENEVSVMFFDENGAKKYKNEKNDVFFDVFVNKTAKLDTKMKMCYYLNTERR